VIRTSEWVIANTRPDDRILAAWTAGVYLRTGRAMAESNPPGSSTTAYGPAPFAVPGRYVAQRLLHDDIAYVVIESPALRVERDLDVVRSACPHVLERMTGERGYPAHFRVHRDESCLLPISQRTQ
jgi:hypothetical protein